MPTRIRFTTFPRTESPPSATADLIGVFRKHEPQIGTLTLDKGLTSDAVLAELRTDLLQLGFIVEGGKLAAQKIRRPVFFGENGLPDLQYQIDAYHPQWRFGLEIEAGRAWMGNAIYRDLVQALVMVDLDCLALAVPNSYRYQTKGKKVLTRTTRAPYR